MKPTPSSTIGTLPLDPRTGAVISPIVAAALCIQPGGILTQHQAETVDVLKQELPIFAVSWRSHTKRLADIVSAGGR